MLRLVSVTGLMVCLLALSSKGQESKLELPSDLPSSIRKEFELVEQDIERTQAEGDAPQAEQLRTEFAASLRLLEGEFEPVDAKQPALHAIGMYRGHIANANVKRIGNRIQGQAKVRVQQTGQPVVLLLCAYEPVQWKVEIDEGVEIQKVYLSGYHPQEIEGLPENLPLENFSTTATRTRIGYSTAAGNRGHELFVERVEKECGMPLFTFQGATVHTGQTFIIGPENPTWRYHYASSALAPLYKRAAEYERNQAQIRVEPLRYTGVFQEAADAQRSHLQLCEFSPGGPIKNTERRLPEGVTLVTHDPETGVWYGVVNRNICRLDLESLKSDNVVAKGNTPRMSWPSGLTFDTQRRRLVVASYGSGMPLYTYSLGDEQWRPLNNDVRVEFAGLAYNGEEDVYYAIVRPYPKRQLSVARMSANGQISSITPITTQLNVSRSPLEPMQLAAAGKYAVMTVTPRQPTSRIDKDSASNVYVIDIETGDVIFEGPQHWRDRNDSFESETLPRLWNRLEQPGNVDLTMWRMALGGDETAVFIQDSLAAIPKPDGEQIKKLIRELDDEDYQVRIAAAAALEALGGQAGEQLLEAYKNSDSLELRKQAHRLIVQAASGTPNNPEVRKDIRAAKILGRILTPRAHSILEKLAAGPPLHARTLAAQKVLAMRPAPVDEPPEPLDRPDLRGEKKSSTSP